MRLSAPAITTILAIAVSNVPAAAQHASKDLDDGVRYQHQESVTARCCVRPLIGATTGALFGTLFIGAASEIGGSTSDGARVLLGGAAAGALVGWLVSPERPPAAESPFLGGAIGALLGAAFVEVANNYGDDSFDGAVVVLGGFSAGAVIGWLMD